MQIVLEDDQYRRLAAASARTGASIGALVRRAVDVAHRPARDPAGVAAALEASFGAWDDLDVDGEHYVERLRTGAQWARLGGDHAPSAP